MLCATTIEFLSACSTGMLNQNFMLAEINVMEKKNNSMVGTKVNPINEITSRTLNLEPITLRLRSYKSFTRFRKTRNSKTMSKSKLALTKMNINMIVPEIGMSVPKWMTLFAINVINARVIRITTIRTASRFRRASSFSDRSCFGFSLLVFMFTSDRPGMI